MQGAKQFFEDNYILCLHNLRQVGSVWFGDGSSYPDEVCDHLDNGEYDDIQTYVQKTISSINLTVMLCQAIPPVIFLLFIGQWKIPGYSEAYLTIHIFIGPWSDRAGRKKLILVPLLGYCFVDLLFLINSIFFEELVVEFMMLEIFQVK